MLESHKNSRVPVSNCYTHTHTHTHTRTQQAALEAEKAELELHQKILREAAEKTRATSSREESLHTLTAHRLRAKEDRTMLADEKRVRV